MLSGMHICFLPSRWLSPHAGTSWSDPRRGEQLERLHDVFFIERWQGFGHLCLPIMWGNDPKQGCCMVFWNLLIWCWVRLIVHGCCQNPGSHPLTMAYEVNLWYWIWWIFNPSCLQSWWYLRLRCLYWEERCPNGIFSLFLILLGTIIAPWK